MNSSLDNNLSSSTKEQTIKNNWQLWCRLCAQEDFSEKIHFFRNDKTAVNIRNISLIEAIESYFNITISDEDYLPKTMCKKCFTLITALVNYSERISKAQKMFNNLLLKAEEEYCDLQSVRLKFGLMDDEVLSQFPIAEIHYFETKLETTEIESNSIKKDVSEISSSPTIKGELRKANDIEMNVEVEGCREELLYDEENECESADDEEDPFSSVGEDKEYNLEENILNGKKRKKLKRKAKHRKSKGKEQDIENNLEDIKLDITCKHCDEQFTSFQPYRQHLITQHDQYTTPKEWICPACDKILTSSIRLERHLRVHIPREEPEVLPCPECGKHFPTNTRLKAHIKYKHKPERFMCEECGACITTKANLQFHMLTHTDNAPLECEVCKKKFKYARRLKIHMETHDSQKHICNICGLQLNTRITLRGHMSVHNDIMKYKCEFCGRAFKLSKTLKFHLISHTGLKPYTCDFCDRAFTNGANCRLHKKKVHPEEWAALEAAGRTKNVARTLPNIETLKALTRAAGNLTSIVNKQGNGGKKFHNQDDIVLANTLKLNERA
uniref:Protein krueppel n=1 Tax=Glossina austeni TaxID=7395 RepID=A0A1A9V5N2_GLOAU